MRRMYLLYVASIVLALGAGCLAIVFILMTELQYQLPSLRRPLDRIGGIIVSNDAVFLASWYAGRIYKFDFSGNLLNTIDVHGEPVWITQDGESVVVHYSGREWALDDPSFRVRNPGGTTATVERTWWGHPVLVVRRVGGMASRASLQPWYVTILRNTYPAALWIPIAFAFTLAALWLRRRLRS